MKTIQNGKILWHDITDLSFGVSNNKMEIVLNVPLELKPAGLELESHILNQRIRQAILQQLLKLGWPIGDEPLSGYLCSFLPEPGKLYYSFKIRTSNSDDIEFYKRTVPVNTKTDRAKILGKTVVTDPRMGGGTAPINLTGCDSSP